MKVAQSAEANLGKGGNLTVIEAPFERKSLVGSDNVLLSSKGKLRAANTTSELKKCVIPHGIFRGRSRGTEQGETKRKLWKPDES